MKNLLLVVGILWAGFGSDAVLTRVYEGDWVGIYLIWSLANVALGFLGLFHAIYLDSLSSRTTTFIHYIYLIQSFISISVNTILKYTDSGLFESFYVVSAISCYLLSSCSDPESAFHVRSVSFVSAQSECLGDTSASPLLRDFQSTNLSISSRICSMSDMSGAEISAVEELRAIHKNQEVTVNYALHDWFKLAWSRDLKAGSCLEALDNHLYFIRKFSIDAISIADIIRNFSAGFSVIAGRDLTGRPMLWQRMRYMVPGSISLPVGIKSTWMALDAALADASSNRSGICLVYDFFGIGLNNISLNLFDIKNGAIACGAGHPSHISRVVFLNAPMIFRMGYRTAQPFLPHAVTSVVEFLDVDTSGKVGFSWAKYLCEPSQLPRYILENDFEGLVRQSDVDHYVTWLLRRLHGQRLLYEVSTF